MPTKNRSIQRNIHPQHVVEGAGVHLQRSIATRELDYLDPFLLFDHFGSDNPADYLAGFPLHPHRGIETVTYMLSGSVNHKNSLGNAGSIHAGDVQWMTAGRGIMHEEMPQPVAGKMEGFQLWVNLPAKLKMSRPRYQEISGRLIPEIIRLDGTKIRVIAGKIHGTTGPVMEIAAEPTYLDITIPSETTFRQAIPRKHTVFAYVFRGSATVGGTEAAKIIAPCLVSFGDGDEIQIIAGATPVRFLLVSGQPLNEPIARYGPFVMNTREEIEQALRDLQNGNFVR
jgi:redox-sensitive bicupin YhaK (pirin superfamily)